MKIMIEIPKEMHKAFIQGSFGAKYSMYDLVGCVMNGTPLPEYMKELGRRLLMEVDGGTDDRYLRYADVCDRISSTIDTYIKTESEEIENEFKRPN